MGGRSVSGKSSVANAILGQGKFTVRAKEDTPQKQADWQYIIKDGRRFEVNTTFSSAVGGSALFAQVSVILLCPTNFE